MKNIAIVGATGYTGSELIRLLNSHKKAKVVYLTTTSQAGIPIKALYPKLDSELILESYSLEKMKKSKADIVFLATPHGTSMQYAEELLANNILVIDLSADFRFNDPAVYEKKYPKHICPNLCKEASYGLVEVYRDEIAHAKLIGNPGCYVTSVLLPMIPIKDKVCDIIVDSKSGVSGAGVKVEAQMKDFIKEADFKVYGVGTHRHQIEIETYLDAKIEFTPHLLPIDRGILSTIYFKSKSSLEELQSILENFYKDEIFVKFLQEGDPKISDVAWTNKCVFKLYKGTKPDSYIMVSVIDNLIKGASGQAIQNMNVMCGFKETEGLI